MDKDSLIYDLIFSETTVYSIDISKYISDMYKYDKFIDEIKSVLKKSKVSIIKEKIMVDSVSVIWEIKVKK